VDRTISTISGRRTDMTILRNVPVTSDAGLSAPAANRAQAPRWRDPRLVAGVVIVALCVLLGSRVLAGADDTVAVFSLRHDLPRGASLDRGDLSVTHVHFGGQGAERYVDASTALAPGAVVTHDLAAGELLPQSAITSSAGPELIEIPLSVAPDDLPTSVRRGATVDVWVTPKVATAGEDRVRAGLALDDVVVVAVPVSGGGLAPTTTRQVIVGLEQSRADELADALGQMADGRVVIVRRAGP
jgi:hypothetical protein